jgi:hypothetical protein
VPFHPPQIPHGLAWYSFTDKILRTVGNKMQGGGIHCDLKAFYCVNTELLHLKVNFMELAVYLNSGSNCTCMTQSYIEIKSLDFKYSVYSDWEIIKHRVHQRFSTWLFTVSHISLISHQPSRPNSNLYCLWMIQVSEFVNLGIQDFELVRSPVLIPLFQPSVTGFNKLG